MSEFAQNWQVDDQPVLHLPGNPQPEDTFDVNLPDICLQIQDPRGNGHPPCISGEDRTKIEAAVRAAIESDFPGAYIDSACVGRGQPAGEAAAFGIWTTPDSPLTEAQKEAMRAGFTQPIDRAANQTIAFFLSNRFISRLARRAWNEMPKRLDDKGIPQLNGYVHLTDLRVAMQPPATVVTIIDGYDERPLPDASFTVTIAETFRIETGEIEYTPVQDLDPHTRLNDILAALLLGGSIFLSLWFVPFFALAVYQSVQLRRAGAPDRSGVGSAVTERFMPGSIPLPGGTKRVIGYSGHLVVKPHGLFVGGFLGAEQPRTPSVSLVGPSTIKAAKGQGIVHGHFRAEVGDLRGLLTYSWTSDAEVRGSGPRVTVRFDPQVGGERGGDHPGRIQLDLLGAAPHAPPKRQRVAPYGSAVATPKASWKVKRYRCQGGGPALGALKGAVKASPSTSAGHPASRYRPAARSSVRRSATLAASPSRTRSMPSSLTDIVQAGFAARLRVLRVPGPLVK